jgi:ParB-like chromosome segregation protein Spo0J
MEVDERGQWVAMLSLNRATHAMSVLEEAMVLREMVAMGMTQTEIGQMLNRHKSWVSRRIGLIERLHPELVEQIREGILPPGAGRRLLVLPAGNQLELAAVAMQHGLGSQETELLVRLWKNADPPVRDYLLAHPRAALATVIRRGVRAHDVSRSVAAQPFPPPRGSAARRAAQAFGAHFGLPPAGPLPTAPAAKRGSSERRSGGGTAHGPP